MNHISRMLCAAILMSSIALHGTVTYFSPRSQSVDSANELVGWANDYHINLCGADDWYGAMSVKAEYTRSFKPGRISRCLFGPSLSESSCDTDSINIQGSLVANRSANAWLADYFGLPTDFQSTFSVRPRVDNFLVDFNFYFGLDRWLEGSYFRVHAPVVHTRWNLHYCEAIGTPGINPYEPGYFSASPTGDSRTGLLNSFADYISGNRVPALTDGATVFQPLVASRINVDHALRKTRLSDIIWALGYNMFLSDDYHLGLNVRGAIPTGNRPKGLYLFEPTVGNGKHWELGGGLTSHYTFYRNCDETFSAGLYFDANLTHQFKARQCRVFDLVNGANSRYMLAEYMGSPVLSGLQGGGVTPSAQFRSIFAPVANLTRMPIKVSSSVQADMTLLLDLSWCGWSFDVGYNFWARSCEKLHFDASCSPLATQLWALKGDASVYGFRADTGAAVQLSATNSQATIYSGTNRTAATIAAATFVTNPAIDNPALATVNVPPALPVALNANTLLGAPQVNTSVNPVLLTVDDIDFCSARTRGISHKAFAHFNYTFLDSCNCIAPYVGIGGSVEIAQRGNCGGSKSTCGSDDSCGFALPGCAPLAAVVEAPRTSSCNTTCNPCKDNCRNSGCNTCALSQWAVWLKGGFSFH